MGSQRLVAVLAATLVIAVGTPALAWYGPASTVSVTVTGVESQAQLASTLQSMGYTDIRLSPLYPNPDNPYPERDPYWAGHLSTSPVHPGWNGSAKIDGIPVRVWVDQRPVR